MQKSLVSFSATLRSLILHKDLIRSILFSRSASSSSDFLPSYLVAKCGFSPDKAAKAAEYIPSRVRSPDQPDSVIAFLKSHGFNDSHLKKLFSSYPQVLALGVEKTLVPKFHTFQEVGFTGDDLITLICSNPAVLGRSMENRVLPTINLWRNLLGSHSSLMKCFTRSHWPIINFSLQRTMSNISILRDCGLSDDQIGTVMRGSPNIITLKSDMLNEFVARVERLGLPRGSSNFHWALYALSMVSEDNLRAKVEFFKKFGWSEDDFSKALRNSPTFITPSLKNLEEKMEFLVKEAGCLASYIALNPVILCYSLEKRLIPRVKVLKALNEKGLSCGNRKLLTVVVYTDKMFFEKYVCPYEKEIPHLRELFKTSS